MLLNIDAGAVSGLNAKEQATLAELVKVYHDHESANETKRRYYEARVTLGEVNLGIALPDGLRRLRCRCPWGRKVVDVLAARSMFDGFVSQSGENIEDLDRIAKGNRLIGKYKKATKDELKYGVVFATLAKDKKIGCKIRFYSPYTAAALWNGDKDRIEAGFVIVDTAADELKRRGASVIHFHTETAVIVLTRSGKQWSAKRYQHKMGRPLMEPLVWDATNEKPLGQSRLKGDIEDMIDDWIRLMATSTLSLEFATTPQKYLLGITDEQYDKVIADKFKQYMGAIIAATTNPDTGEKPTFGQLPQGTLGPHTEKLRILSTQFGAATGLPVTDTGVVNDANPTSGDAIEAQTKTLVSLAEDLNTANGEALGLIAKMALAVAHDVSLEEITQEYQEIDAHFKNPAMPSIAASADAALKIASVRPEFAQTDTYLEMNGFDQATIRRIKAQEQRARGLALVSELEA